MDGQRLGGSVERPPRLANRQRLGAELPDRRRLQLHSAFCNVAFHVLFFFDHYLDGGTAAPVPPQPFEGEQQRPHTLPLRVYTRDDLLGYLTYCRQKADTVLSGLNDDAFERPARIGRPFGDLLLNNLLQLTDHTAQLNLFLGQQAGV